VLELCISVACGGGDKKKEERKRGGKRTRGLSGDRGGRAFMGSYKGQAELGGGEDGSGLSGGAIQNHPGAKELRRERAVGTIHCPAWKGTRGLNVNRGPRNLGRGRGSKGRKNPPSEGKILIRCHIETRGDRYRWNKE